MEFYNIKFIQAEEGVISKINLDEGEYVAEGQILCVIEGDNVEYALKSPVNGKIHKKHVIGERQVIRKNAIIFDIDTNVNPEKAADLAEIQEGFKKVKEGLAELEAAPREMRKAMFDLNNIGNDEEYDFGEDANLSNKLFAEKYGNKTYRLNEITPALLKELILHKCDFSIKTKNISEAVDKVEAIIEKCGYKCRVYTENRSSALAAAAIPGFGLLAGAAAAIGIAAHNLATYDPDFEIGKNFFDDKVNVTYKK